MKRVSLQKSRRNQYVVLLASLLVATTPCANASTYCLRANELPLVSDPLVKGKIEERLRAIPVMKSHAVRQVDPRFAIAWQDEEECRKLFQCYHLLLDIRDGAATIVFAYRGSGTIQQLMTPPSTWSDTLQDHYTFMAFETDDFNWIRVRAPRLSGPVWIGAIPSDDLNLRSCGYLKKM